MALNELINHRKSCRSFTGKPMEPITDKADPRLKPARLAPSAVNSQPWFFAHEGDTIHIWCSRKDSPLDADIAVAHLYVANEETFLFFKSEKMTDLPGFGYIGSVTP